MGDGYCRFHQVSKSKALTSFYEADPNFSKDAPYRKSYYQYKGILYKTKYLHTSDVLQFELEELEVLLDNLKHVLDQKDWDILGFSDLKEKTKELKKLIKRIPTSNAQRILQSKLQRIFNVSIINSVTLDFASDITLFWCRKCHRLYFPNPNEIDLDLRYCYPICPICSTTKPRILEQTPVWVSKDDFHHPIVPLTVGAYNLSKNGWRYWNRGELPTCPKCGQGKMRFYIHKDPARFLEKSALKCDTCGEEVELYNRDYSLALPTPNITRPILSKTYNYLDIEFAKYIPDLGVNLKEELTKSPLINLEYIEELLYVSKVEIKKVVVGMKFGLKGKRTYPTRKTGICIETDALYIKLSDNYFSVAKDFMSGLGDELSNKRSTYLRKLGETTLKHVILHSLAHAFMGRIPNYSGIGLENFEYIYSPSRNEVLIYEASDGSLGGLEILTKIDEDKEEPIIYDYLTKVKEDIVDCSCEGVCKYCLALPGCPEFNKNLDRFSLMPLFGIDNPQEIAW